jgi:biopolymer transport protein ExbD
MSGSQDQKENPVAINVVPMVDVIFCLCLFFMCSLKFKQLEGKFDSWLPKNKGAGTPSNDILDEIRVVMFWNATTQETERWLGTRKVGSLEELETLLVAARSDFERLGKIEDAAVTIDGEWTVPWSDVIAIVNLCKKNRLEKVEFAFGAKPKGA